MEIKILLAVPEKGDSVHELKRFLAQENADLYIFPEGFLNSEVLNEALAVIERMGKYVIAGFKDLDNNGQHKALVIDNGIIVDAYTKCILTKGEKEKGKQPGKKIACVNTKFGKIGVPICYEIHFPEVSRIMCLEDPVLLVNIIGTGMYHDLQLDQWTSLAKARAIENEVFVVGCSHFADAIPVAYVYAPSGKCELLKQSEHGGFAVTINLDKSREKRLQYSDDRVPELFAKLSESEKIQSSEDCL